MISDKIDEVSRNSIWREHCEKELAHTQLNTNFSVSNVKKMSILPEKPNYVLPDTRIDKEEISAANTLLRTLCSVQDEEVPPNQKFELPVTSSQEVGWIHKPLVAPNPMFKHPREACEITKYADAYYEMVGATPFSRKDAM